MKFRGSATIALGVRRLTEFGHVGLGGSFGWAIPAAGVAFAIQIALLAQRMDHHPELCIGWRRVTVTYTTHDADGVTSRDIAAVNAVDAIAPKD